MPAGTQPGTVVTLRERGMPTIGRGRRGDQQVVLNVVIPRNLSAPPARAARGAARLAHRREPRGAGRRVAALEGQAGAALIRLAIRGARGARRDRARRAARAGPGGLRAGRWGGICRVRAVRRARRAARRSRPAPPKSPATAVAGLRHRARRRLGRPLARISQTRADRSPSRAPALARAARPTASTSSSIPGQAFGTGAHPDHPHCAWSCCSEAGAPERSARRPRLRLRSARHRRREARLRARHRARPRPRGDRRHARATRVTTV